MSAVMSEYVHKYVSEGTERNENGATNTLHLHNHHCKPTIYSSEQMSTSSSTSSKTLAQRLKSFDYHSAIESEFRVRTSSGAFLSVITLFLIFSLLFSEYYYNLTPNLREYVHVNATSPDGIQMEIDISFPKVNCALINVDSQDPIGQPQSMHINRQHRIWKHRISSNGKMIGKRSKFELGNTFQREEHLKDYSEKKEMKFHEEDMSQDEEDCGSCYGAGEENECCNTCDDVKRAYVRKGWQFDPKMEIKQCRRVMNSHDMVGEGCNIHGIVALSAGGGNLHLTPGHELENFGKTTSFLNLQDFINQAFETFDVSHTINTLRFGPGYPGEIHQLDNQERTVKDAYGMYQYYIQIVPTLYKFLNGTEILTNQYSVTEHMRHVHPGSNKGLPGVYFFYEVSALHVQIEEYRHGWVRFLTSVAGVVGGIFSAMSMADLYLHSKTSQSSTLVK